jgi:hypothetical protein
MDYDFITTCNWTATGTYTLRAYRGSSTNVASSYTIYYRKKELQLGVQLQMDK